MTAIEIMKIELEEIKEEQAQCMDEEGLRVKNTYKHRYQFLCSQARSFKDAIEFMEKKIYGSAHQVV